MPFRAPNVFVLIVSILVVVAALTWIVPAGEYRMEEKDVRGSTREVVVPDSYRVLDETEGGGAARHQGPWELLQAPMRTLGGHAAEVMGFLLLIGGAFAVLQETGALLAALHWLTRRLGGRKHLIVPVLMFAFSLGGATFGMAEESIAFVMITVPLAISLRFDTVTGIAIPFLGSQAGFATAWLNPFTLGIAKGIADVEAGFEGYRLVCWAVVTAALAALVTWHAVRVAADPSRSPTPGTDAGWRARLEGTAGEGAAAHAAPEMTGRRVLVLLVFFAAIGVIAFGGSMLGWYITELAAVFLGMAIFAGAVAGMSPGRIADAFTAGAKDLAPVALLIMFATSIPLVAEDGKIIHTILHAIASTLDGLGETFAVWLMFLIQTAINFFVPSGSGQAALTIPVMAPLADVLEVPREKAILAYQFGDGFTNILIPTNPVLIGCIAAAKVDYGDWVAWVWRPVVSMYAIGFVLLALAPYA